MLLHFSLAPSVFFNAFLPVCCCQIPITDHRYLGLWSLSLVYVFFGVYICVNCHVCVLPFWFPNQKIRNNFDNGFQMNIWTKYTILRSFSPQQLHSNFVLCPGIMSTLIQSYEQQYSVLTADITSKIGRLKSSNEGILIDLYPSYIENIDNLFIKFYFLRGMCKKCTYFSDDREQLSRQIQANFEEANDLVWCLF